MMSHASRANYNRVTISKSAFTDMALTPETRQFAAQNATRLLGRLAFQMNATMKSADPDAVHDLRVAIRRFTQALAVFKACFPGKEKRKIKRRLKKLMIVAGSVRNCDVASKLLAKSRSTEAAGLRGKVQSQRKESERTLTATLKRRMDRKSSLKWRSALESALSPANDNVGHESIAETARRLLPGMAKDFLKLGGAAAAAKASSEKLHLFRIESKKLRYTLEIFAPVYGSSMNQWIDKIREAQNLLGDVNDCVTAREIISEYKGGAGIDNWLMKRERRKADAFQRWWPDAFGGREIQQAWTQYLGAPLDTAAAKKPMARATSLRDRATARAR
jgi:CHAD domain-containing protein